MDKLLQAINKMADGYNQTKDPTYYKDWQYLVDVYAERLNNG